MSKYEYLDKIVEEIQELRKEKQYWANHCHVLSEDIQTFLESRGIPWKEFSDFIQRQRKRE